MDGDTTVAYLREIDPPQEVANLFFAPQFSVNERRSRTNQISPWIANLPYDRRMDWLGKDLTDGLISDKSYRVLGLC
jgi:hypothetical protein